MEMRKGLTLVELLVVLAILAAIATSVAVSSASAVDRGRVDRTIRQGETMREALEREDGLSLTSDLGQIFDVTTTDDASRNAVNLSRLGYLWSPSNRYETAVENGANATPFSAFKELPRYRQLAFDFIPTNFTALTGVSAAKAAALTNAMAKTCGLSSSLGAGWRGPYCRERNVMNADFELRDGFGGLWECETSPTNFVLVSRGQDREADGVSANKSWQEEDRLFDVGVLKPATLVVSLKEEPDDLSRLHVFIYEPHVEIASGASPLAALSVKTTWVAATNSPSLSATRGISVGERVVFAFAETADKCIPARPRHVVVKPGVNRLENLKLVESAP